MTEADAGSMEGRPPTLSLLVKADEAVAKRVPRLPIADDVTRGHSTKAREDDFEVLLSRHLPSSEQEGR